MKKNTLICFLQLLIIVFSNSLQVFPQEKQTLKIAGRLVDSLSRKPLDYLTIKLNTEHGKPVSFMLSRKDGSFEFARLQKQNYIIIISGLGFKSKEITVVMPTAIEQPVDLGTISMQPVNNNITEVKVTAARPLISQQIDRLSYDIQADPESQGSSVLEMMRKVPLLSLDADDNVQLKGNSNYKILINGKPSAMMERNAKEILRTMPASTILRIEVITIPPSKYDAEGLAGIINIITAKNINDGYAATLNLFSTAPAGGPGTGASISFKQRKFGMTAFGGGGIYNTPETMSFLNRIPVAKDADDLKQERFFSTDSRSGYLGTELSYETDSLNLFSASFNINGIRSDKTDALFSGINSSSGAAQQYRLENADDGTGAGLDMSLNYQLSFKRDKNRMFTASYRYYEFDNEQFSNIKVSDTLNYSRPDYRQQNSGSASEHTFQLDYVHTIKKIIIETGIKGIFRINKSDFEYWSRTDVPDSFDLDPLRSNRYDNRQNVLAAYNTWQFGYKNWGFKAGLRIEQTLIDARFAQGTNPPGQQHLNLVPALAVSKKTGAAGSLTLGYMQRIQRPGIYQLNPFTDRSNPDVEQSGNPALRPVTAHTLQAGYSIRAKAFFNLAFDYTFYNALINQVAEYDITSRLTRINYRNTGKAKLAILNFSVNYPVSKNLSLNSNNKLGYGQVKGTNNSGTLQSQGWLYAFALNSAYSLNGGWRLNGSWNIRSRNFSLQRTTNGYISSSLGFSKDLIKDKWSFAASANNPFTKYRNAQTEVSDPGFYQINSDQTYYRSFRISTNYKFGRLKEAPKKSKRAIKNDDVAN